jgi:hypothetical protein
MSEQFHIHGNGDIKMSDAIILLQEIIPIAMQYYELHRMAREIHTEYLGGKLIQDIPEETRRLFNDMTEHLNPQFAYLEDTVMRKIIEFLGHDTIGLP